VGIFVALVQFGVFGDARLPVVPGKPTAGEASLSISRGTGPSGTEIRVSGRGFGGQELVEISFHTELIATARTDDDGIFRRVPARIPGSFDVFAPVQFDIRATGRSTVRSARVPFLLTN